ncbi:tyrosine-type recombinase/integrase [Wenzhouxiangella marina]|uniref:Integrase n=1 Tax=Wenzhouxiangella marina TaxID=1579979 RepID=A0A0K0XX08_9GAMM|nr:integrase arm-type DNA-binding domain-containing protein [Wenzhouxiangella marina]AKS42208.1 integrase [Wenzhouxiangella marina]MBB6086020.1 integrase [Wenzhouxiangella marina]
MRLTDTAIRGAKPDTKTRKLFDGGGLYLEVAPSGGKWWRYKYRFGGKEKRLSLGVYPDVSLKDARERHGEARKLLANGTDPSQHRKAEKAATAALTSNSFEIIAREWHGKHTPTWTEKHAETVIRRLELNIFPWLGKLPAAEITAPQLLEALRRIEARGALETAHRVLSICGQVFRYAIATGRAERDPSGDLRGALPPVKPKHFAAKTDPKEIGPMLRAIDAYKGTTIVRCALRLAPLVFVRPGELRHAEWADFDLDAREWRFLVTKTQTPHIVPLSTQALEILEELRPVTGRGKYLFPSNRSAKRPISDNTILAALRRMDIGKDEMTGHGFRAMARTILDEVLGFRPDYIEHQLAHAVRDPNGRAHNRTAHLEDRHTMMQTWCDYLTELKCRRNHFGITTVK